MNTHPTEFTLSGNIIDAVAGTIRSGTIVVSAGRIAAISYDDQPRDTYLLPGFVDAHVHIESSMLTPTEFARLATPHGTTATVSDPHEIANVLGVEGVRYMQRDAARTPLKIHFGAPSCVPATPFDKAGGTIDDQAVAQLLDDPSIVYLTEMMNFPGVLMNDPQVHAKLAAARARGKVIDGHCPGLRGTELQRYIDAGISTDHESRAYDEGREKLQRGMKLIIREGSAAKDFNALHPLLAEFPDRCMFCSDDKHPDDLVAGHINLLVARVVAAGIDPMIAIRAASVTPVRHYGLNVGLLQVGDPADLIEVTDLQSFGVLRTWIDGELVAERGRTLLPRCEPEAANQFSCPRLTADDLQLPATDHPRPVQIIAAIDGQLVTDRIVATPPVHDGRLQPSVAEDLLLMALVDRYGGGTPALCLVKNFGLKRGAIASSVSHDSHNLIAVGVDAVQVAAALNALIDARGGVSLVDNDRVDVLPLPIAGLMSAAPGAEVAATYSRLDAGAKGLGSTLHAPYMTLSFMALTVIPALKIGPAGLFDVLQFQYTPLWAD